MARSKKRSFRRRSGRRADWVYRANGQGAVNTGGTNILSADIFGTYEAAETSLPSATAAGKWLYDSHNHTATLTRVGGAGAPILGHLGGASRAEGKRALCLAVQGVIIIRNSTWAVGNRRQIGFRIGAFEQAPETGQMALDPNYSMWGNIAPTTVADWANDRNWVWERRIKEDMGAGNNPNQTIYVRTRFRKYLAPNQGLGLFMETTSASDTVILGFWLRTLVVDEG